MTLTRFASLFGKTVLWLIGLWIVAAFVIAVEGCSVVTTPDLVKGHGASPSGNEMNSGVVSIPAVDKKTGHAPGGPIQIDAPTLAAYNDLITTYGKQFHPALKAGDGVTLKGDGSLWIDHQHFDNYGLMVRWSASRITF